ncbi:hypothetical protein [Saccharicrinis sp. FJH54]|uniref:hypothetical protein n=1 Tax=Saccharicrinis sp. FJH54 TaxID=3344665 RepID=UPI0035D47347
MDRFKNILIVFAAVLLTSCSIQKRSILEYGSEVRLLVYSDSTIFNGKVTFNMGDLTFHFKTENFRDVIIQNYDIDFEAYTYLKDFTTNFLNNENLKIKREENDLYINNIKTKFPLSYDINFVMDHLVREGNFYLEKNNKPVNYIEYIYWNPQYMGTIYSKWIVNKKVVYEFIHGTVE